MAMERDNLIQFPGVPVSRQQLGRFDIGGQDAKTGNGGGGGMDGLERRVERLETDVGTLKTDVSAIKATLAAEFPALRREMSGMATKAGLDVATTELHTLRQELRQEMSHSATKADLNSMATKMVVGFFAAMAAIIGIAFTAATFVVKFPH